ncbi:MAG: PEP-CTERM sorting domain-containing protein [Pseudomonadales bacterium]
MNFIEVCRRVRWTLGLSALLLLPFTASAGMISLTGADLLTQGGVSFPNGLPVPSEFNPQAIAFGDSAANNEVLVRWDILAAGSIAFTDPAATITLNGNVTRISEDFDFSVGLWDGTNLVGVIPVTDGAAAYGITQSTSDGITNLEAGYSPIPSNEALLALGESADFELEWSLGALFDTSVTLSTGSLTNTWTAQSFFDRTQDLSILISKQSAVEALQINSLSISSALINDTVVQVPEPASLLLLLAGFLAAICCGSISRGNYN